MRNLRPIHHIWASKGYGRRGDRREINGQRDLDSSALPVTHYRFSAVSWPHSQRSLFPRFCLLRPGRRGTKEICKQVPGLLKGKAAFNCITTMCRALSSFFSAQFLGRFRIWVYHSHFTEFPKRVRHKNHKDRIGGENSGLLHL